MAILRSISLLVVVASLALADEPRPAISFRLDGPDRQVRAVIDLFRGAKVPHPAAALAAWKHATREPKRLGKPVEALIALFNPAMAGELRTLDGAELALWFEPESGQPAWGAILPGDDGSFAALATALVLTDGQAEGPIVEGLAAVDRLGAPGSPLMARGAKALLVANSPAALKVAQRRSDLVRPVGTGDRLHFAAEPAALDGSKSLLVRRLRAALVEARGPIVGSAGLVGSSFASSFVVEGDPLEVRAAVDPSWLDWLPADQALGVFALAIDPAPANWDAAFRLAERVEKVDPARENLAPLRLRLDLLARTLGLRTDADLLPHLRGVAGWLGAGGKDHAVDRAFLMLHLDDEAVATRVCDRIKPLPGSAPLGAPEAGSAGRLLGKVEGRPVRIFRVGKGVVATWGDGVMEVSQEARTRAERSAGRWLSARVRDRRPAFVAATWPARVPGLVPVDTPLAVALEGGPPVVWSGGWERPGRFRVDGDLGGLDATIGRFLALIPLEPPPDH